MCFDFKLVKKYIENIIPIIRNIIPDKNAEMWFYNFISTYLKNYFSTG